MVRFPCLFLSPFLRGSPAGVAEPAEESIAESLLSQFFAVSINEEEAIPQHQIMHATFTLLVEDPSVKSIRWPAFALLDKFWASAVSPFGAVASLSVDSQVLPFASTLHRPPRFDSVSRSHFYLVSDLPHFVNANEWKIESTSAKGSSINFLLFLPSKQHSSLHFRSSADSAAKLSASGFVIPKWGGVQILSGIEASDNGTLALSEVSLKSAIAGCLVLFRRLMGLPKPQPDQLPAFSLFLPRHADRIVEQFELDSLLRRSFQRHCVAASGTLHVRQRLPAPDFFSFRPFLFPGLSKDG